MYIEGLRAVNGEGEYINDLPDLPGTLYMAIYRSPIAHGKIKRVDLNDVKLHGGIAFGPEELSKVIVNPFPNTVDLPIKYYPFAKDKVRFVGEPIAVVLAKDYYKAIDLLDYVNVEIEELPPVITIEDSLKNEVLLHEEVKTNVAMHKIMRFGNIERAFSESPIVISHIFKFGRHSALPLETYGILARFGDELEVWANIQGPMLQVYFLSRALNIPINKIKLFSPRDIGGSFGNKYSLYPYITLAAAASKLTGKPIRWFESRAESFIASSAGGERKGNVEIASTKDGIIKGIRYTFYEDVGAYVRPPEPGVLFRVQGNLNGAYDIRAIEAEYYVVLTNKSPTGLNRGYGAPPFYFALETAVDKLADEVGIDPLELRLKNLIKVFDEEINGQRFYETVSGGLYPEQDYVKVVKAIEEEYKKWKNMKDVGVGIAVIVEPSGTNLAYVDLALNKIRNPHSASGDYITIALNPDGSVSVFVNGTNEGLGHETTIAEFISKELGIDESLIHVENRVDTTQPWNLASGSYSSRFAPIVMSAVKNGVDELKKRLAELAKKYLEAEEIIFENGRFYDAKNKEKYVDIKRLVSAYHWNPSEFNYDKALSVTSYFYSPLLKPPEDNKINSSLGYAIQAHLAVVKRDEVTGEFKIVKYVISHDAGKMLNKNLLEGQIYGGLLHGIALTFYEELKYDDRGNPLVTLFDSYESPTLSEVIETQVELIHFETPAKYIPTGAYGGGEGPIMAAPAALANAISRLIGKRISELPIRVIE
ncbi:xanthine dehydrogenase family protein molybdopterin-binding subunit [Sulfolobus sp. S-194]|uniref:xanthine dehydrogenase family protein molybdopterin-binding subunit n=1 Tax=Sulfolobus sp. S-194 TaxID=2512240 RepID=UPI001437366F|nr:xanthine dehydrogenase family protein molybdopterin-binding subunit [Sulfolobus sp. S-194]QIW22942.1 xanthine dehydrogenase family protein molybdopterin-binding subunit [Sulfolobus sp. S-194]